MTKITKINVAILIAVILTHLIILFNIITLENADNIIDIIENKLLGYFLGFILPALLGFLCLPFLRKVHLITFCYVVFAWVNWLYIQWAINRPLSEDGRHREGSEYIFWYFILNNILSAVFVLLVKLADVLITKAHNNAKQKKET